MEDKILVVGGLNIGLLSSKSHVYDAIGQKVNFAGELQMPMTDVSRFFYKYRETKVYVVGSQRIQEFDLETKTWSLKSFGHSFIINKEP